MLQASFGITYMMPTHEVQRDIHESLKILGQMRKSEEVDLVKINSVVQLLNQAYSVVGGIGRLMRQTREEETFELKRAAERALDLMRFKFERNNIRFGIEGPDSINVKGSERLIIIMLLNFLDNSFYWLLRKSRKPRDQDCYIPI